MEAVKPRRINSFRFSIKRLLFVVALIAIMIVILPRFNSVLPTTYWVPVDRTISARNDTYGRLIREGDRVEFYLLEGEARKFVVRNARVLDSKSAGNFSYFLIRVNRDERLRLWRAWFSGDLHVDSRS